MDLDAPKKERVRRRRLDVVDLFAGGGGFSTGIALGCRDYAFDVDLTAINCWPEAVDTHKLNHPWAKHLCQRIEHVQPRNVVPGGKLDLLAAAPSCVYHSTARGGRPMSDQLRSDPWLVNRWLSELDVAHAIVENVPEFVAWGPVSKRTQRPIKSLRGTYFAAWKRAIEGLGYNVDWKVLNAADYGGATTRRRFFLMARKGKKPIAWPRQTHSEGGRLPDTRAWRSARGVIDWSIQGTYLTERARPLAANTMRRIVTGLVRHNPWLAPYADEILAGREPLVRVEGALDSFLLGQQGGAVGRSVTEPAPTVAGAGAISLTTPVVTSVDRPLTNRSVARSVEEPLMTATGNVRMGVAEPVLLGVVGRAASHEAKSVDDPIGTLLSRNPYGVVEPVLVGAGGPMRQGEPRSVDVPLPSLTTDPHLAVVEPVLMPPEGVYGGNVARSVDTPMHTVTQRGNQTALVEPYLVPFFGEGEKQSPRSHSVDAPLPSVTGHGAGGVVDPILVEYNGNGNAHGVDEPLPTQAGSDRFALVVPVVREYRLRIRFRMLRVHELQGAMGFPREYVFLGNQGDQVKMIGNAVEVNQGRALTGAVFGIVPVTLMDFGEASA